jgi:hypothetical protein
MRLRELRTTSEELPRWEQWGTPDDLGVGENIRYLPRPS